MLLISKNNFHFDTHQFENETGGARNVVRNWWGTIDSAAIRGSFYGAGAESITFLPYRLGIVDTAASADTTAPDGPDTVAAFGFTESSILITWSAVTSIEESNGGAIGLSGYRAYSSRIRDTSLWILRGAVGPATLAFVDSGLGIFETYFYRVTAFDAAARENQSFFSDSISAAQTPDSTPPSVPVLMAPSSLLDTNLLPIPFSWSSSSDSSGIQGYRLQVDTSGAFASPFVDSFILFTNASLTLTANDSYFWRIIAVDSANNTAISANRFFRVDTTLPAASLQVSPADGANTSAIAIAFTWTASADSISGLLGYKLQIDSTGLFSSLVVDSFTTATTLAETLPPGDTYYWRVLAIDSAQNVNTFGTRSFRIDTASAVAPANIAVHPSLPAGANINPVGVDLTALISVSVVGDTADMLQMFTVDLEGNAGAMNRTESVFLYRDANRNATLDTSVDTVLASYPFITGQTYRFGLGWMIGSGDSFIVAARFRDTTPVGETVRASVPALGIKTGNRDTSPSVSISAPGLFTISYVASTIVSVDQATPANGSITAVDTDRTVVMALSIGGAATGDTLTQFHVRLAGNAGAASVVDSIALYKDGNENGTYEAGLDTIAALLPLVSGTTFGSSSLSATLPDFKSGFDSFLVLVTLRDTATPGDTLRATIPSGMVKTQLRETAPAADASSPATFTVAAAFTTLAVDPLKPAGASISPSGTDLTAVMAMTIAGASNDSLTVLSVAFNGNAGQAAQLDTVFLYRDADRSATLTAGDTALATLTLSASAWRLTSPWALGSTGLDSFLIVVSIRDTVPGSDTLRAYIPANAVKTTNRETVPSSATYAPATFLTESGVSTIVRILVNANTLSETISPLNVDLSRVMSLTIAGGAGDTLQNFGVTLNGNAGAASRLEYILLYRDLNKNGNFDSGAEQYISGLINTSGQTYKINFLGCTLGVTGADSFLVVLSYRDTATSGETVHAKIPAGSCTTSLKTGGPAIAFAAPAAFTIFDLNPPNPFTLLSPAANHDTSTTAVNLRWNASSDGGSGLSAYKAQVSRFANFSTLVADTSTGLSRSLTPLLSPASGGVDSFYWRIQAYDANGNSKASTDTGFFRLDLIAPSKPASSQPPANHDTIATAVGFAWSAATDTFSGLKQYRLQFASDAAFASITIDSTVGLNLAASRTLAASATYYWRVLAEDTAGNTAASDSKRLTIIGAGPTAPTLLAPEDRVETRSTTFTFSWSASTDSFSTIAGYRLQIDTSSSFTSPAIDSANGLATSTTRTLNANATYYWRILVTNAASLTTNSSSRILSTDTICTVALFSPPDATTTSDSRPVFLWLSNMTGVHKDTFTFQLATDTIVPTIVLASTQKATSFQPGATLAGNTYYWRVIAADTAGNSDTSNWRSVTIDTGGVIVDTSPPSSFSLMEPGNNSYTNVASVTFQWALTTDTPSGVSQYRIQVDDDSAFASMLHDTTVASSIDTKSLPLPANAVLYWRVIAIDGSSNQTLSQTTRAVITDTVPPAAPSPLIRPTSGEDTSVGTVAFRFTASSDSGTGASVSGLRRYIVQVDTSGTFSSPVLTGEGTSATIVVAGFSQNTWYWRVVAEDTAGNTTASVFDTFQIISVPPSVPVPVSPISGQFVGDTTISFDWTDAANLGAPLKRYILHASADSTFATIPISTATADTTSASSGAGFSAGTWYWRVAAEDTLGNVSSFSGVANFTLETSPPPKPSFTAPVANLIARPGPTTFSWVASGSLPASGLNGYNLRISTLLDSTVADTSFITSATSYSASINNFAETTYITRVRARSNAGTFGSWSDTIAIRFDSTPPPAPAILAPRNGTSTTVTTPSFRVAAVADTGPDTTVRYVFQASRVESFSVMVTTQISSATISGTIAIFSPTYVFDDSGVFHWRAAAIDTANNQSSWSAADSFQRPAPAETTAPLPVADLMASPDNAGGITLTWSKSPSFDIDSGGQYNIYWNEGRSTSSPDTLFKIVPHTGADSYSNSTSTDTILQSGTWYRFRVKAQDNSGNEDLSNVSVGAQTRSSAPTMAYAVIFNPDAGRKVERNGGIQIMARLVGDDFRKHVDTLTFQFRPESGTIWWNMRPTSGGPSQNPMFIGDESKTLYGIHWDSLSDTTINDGFYEIRAITTERDGDSSTALSVANLIEMESSGSSDSELTTGEGADTAAAERRIDSRRENRVDLTNGRDTTGNVVFPKDSLNETADTSHARILIQGAAARKSNTGSGTAFSLAIGSGSQDQIDAAIGRDSAVGFALVVSLPGGQTTLRNGQFAQVTISYPKLNESGYIPGTLVKPESLVLRAASAGDIDSRPLTILSVDTVNRMITARTDRFSTFLLVAPNPGSGGPGNQSSLARFMVYPNPFRPNDRSEATGREYDPAEPRVTGIVFDNLPARVRIEVYTLRGERIFDRTTAVNDGFVTWNVRNSGSGEKVASGYYIYVVTDLATGQRVSGKIAVIR
ncbi:MAG: hypothetical protein AAB229_06450 [Candidatus Hydrogenedentota bacterium]